MKSLEEESDDEGQAFLSQPSLKATSSKKKLLSRLVPRRYKRRDQEIVYYDYSEENPQNPQRLVVRPAGYYNVHKVGVLKTSGFVFRDFYHFLLDMRVSTLVLLITLLWILINCLFALLYMAGGDSIDNVKPSSFLDNLFFSVQTIQTIGYGRMAPSTDYANTVMVIESWCGAILECVIIGIMFEKFSRPTRIRRWLVWSDVAVVNDKVRPGAKAAKQLVFRVTNVKRTQLCEPRISLFLIRKTKPDSTPPPPLGTIPEAEHLLEDAWWSRPRTRRSLEGGEMAVYELPFEVYHQTPTLRDINMSAPLLPLPWTIAHEIDEDSPLHGLSKEDWAAEDIEVVALLEAIDEGVSDAVQARWSYRPHEVVWDAEFAPMVRRDDEEQVFSVDLARISTILPTTYSTFS